MLKKLIPLLSIFLILASITVPAFAHSGKTDSNGGHYNHSTGEYHYHHGYSAHQHPGGVCPYDYDDQTNHSSGSSESSSSGSCYKPSQSFTEYLEENKTDNSSEIENLRKLAEKHEQSSNISSSSSVISKSDTPSFEGFAPKSYNAKNNAQSLFEKIVKNSFWQSETVMMFVILFAFSFLFYADNAINIGWKKGFLVIMIFGCLSIIVIIFNYLAMALGLIGFFSGYLSLCFLLDRENRSKKAILLSLIVSIVCLYFGYNMIK